MSIDIDTMFNRLEELSCVSSAKKDTGTTRITSIDFELFELERYTNTSNVVFDRWGDKFHGGLLRLPRVRRDVTTEDEIRSTLLSHIPSFLHSDIEIRVEPEVDLDDEYYYLHIETDESIPEGTLEIIEKIGAEYDPNQF